MRTPAGTECRYYYEDFNRGRSQQECRLIQANRDSLPWEPGLCAKCKVPGILRQRPSPDLRLRLTVRKRLGLWKVMELRASCQRHGLVLEDPLAPCPGCESAREAS